MDRTLDSLKSGINWLMNGLQANEFNFDNRY